MTDEIPDIAKRALNLLSDQCNELEGHLHTLCQALRDIQDIAQDHADYDTDGWNRVLYLCQTGGVRAALEAS